MTLYKIVGMQTWLLCCACLKTLVHNFDQHNYFFFTNSGDLFHYFFCFNSYCRMPESYKQFADRQLQARILVADTQRPDRGESEIKLDRSLNGLSVSTQWSPRSSMILQWSFSELYGPHVSIEFWIGSKQSLSGLWGKRTFNGAVEKKLRHSDRT